MSRYKPKGTVYKLIFADPEFEGLEVRAKSISIAELMYVAGLKDSLAVDDPDVAQVEEMFKIFAKALVDWNVDEEVTDADGNTTDVPVPANMDGIKKQEVTFILSIISAWVDTIATVPGFLEKQSNSTKPSLAESIKMDDL